MTTYATDDLKRILDLHKKWWRGEEGGARADLRSADLSGADLRSAVLSGAWLSDGVQWEEYLTDVVPALCTAGGRTLAEVATEEHWNCHSWNGIGVGCPMAAAFGVKELSGIPALYRGQAERFIQLFDALLIPRPTPSEHRAPSHRPTEENGT